MSSFSYPSSSVIPFIHLNEETLKIKIELKHLIYSFTPVTIFLHLLDEEKENRKVIVAKLPYFFSSFFFLDIDSGKRVAQAQLKGKRLSCTLLIPRKMLPSYTHLFITLESNSGFFYESEWIPQQFERKRKKIITLIPCYNVAQFCEKVVKKSLNFSDEIIVVNDGSFDETLQILQSLASEHSTIHLVSWKKNQGKGFSLLEGFKHALKLDFDALVTIDADNQHPPEDISPLAKLIENGADIGIGTRLTKFMPFKNRFANESIAFLLRRIYPNAPQDTQSGMRSFSKSLVQDIVHKNFDGKYEMEFKCLLLALSKRYRIKLYKIPTIYIEKNKSSHFSALKDSLLILKTFFKHLLSKKI